jgi:hypothetical protein
MPVKYTPQRGSLGPGKLGEQAQVAGTEPGEHGPVAQRARAAALAMEIALPGTTYMRQPGGRPPWVRFVVLIACGQVGDNAEWPAIRAAFGAFLQASAAVELLADLTHVGKDAAWAR